MVVPLYHLRPITKTLFYKFVLFVFTKKRCLNISIMCFTNNSSFNIIYMLMDAILMYDNVYFHYFVFIYLFINLCNFLLIFLSLNFFYLVSSPLFYLFFWYLNYIHSKTPHVVTVLWLDSDDVVTILSSTRNLVEGYKTAYLCHLDSYTVTVCNWYIVFSHAVTVSCLLGA